LKCPVTVGTSGLQRCPLLAAFHVQHGSRSTPLLIRCEAVEV
jgi:hypothetical protein